MNHRTELIVEMYKRGDFSFLGLFPKQLAAIELLNDSVTNELTYGGAARGGKSWLLSVWKIMNRLSMDGSVGLIAREERTKLIDTTQVTFWKVIEFLELEAGVDYVFNAGKQKVEFYNGSEELFRELKHLPKKDAEFDRIGSYDLTDAALDEAQQIHYKAVSVLKGRFSELRGRNTYIKNGIKTFEEWQTIPKAFYSCNPSKNWIYTDFYQPFVKKELPKRKAFIVALPTDNPHVDESYIENLRTADKITRERLLHGNFDYDDDPNALCEWTAILDVFNNDHIEIDEFDKWLIADLAMKGRDKFIVMYWEGMVCYIETIEDYSTAKGIENSLRESKKERGVANRRIIADSDGLGSFLSSYLENIIEFHGGASPEDKIYGNIKDQCGFKLAEKINHSEIRIVCDDREVVEEIQKQLSLCLKRSANVDDEKKRLIKKSEMKEKLGYSPDFMDVLLMRMLPEVEQSFEAFA